MPHMGVKFAMRDENGLRTTTQMEDEENITLEGKIDNDIKFGEVDRQDGNTETWRAWSFLTS